MTLRKRLGSAVGRLRVAAGLSQEKLGQLSGLHATTISTVERGKMNVTLDTLDALAAGLRISPWDLLRIAALDEAGPEPTRAKEYQPESSLKFSIVAERTSAGYSAYCPDLPGCAASGPSRKDVERAMREAITAELQNLRRAGAPIPQPSSYTTVVSVTI